MDKDEEEFDFITEKIKDKPIRKRRIILKVIGVIVLGLIFGVMACFSFFAVKPWMSERLTPDTGLVKVVVPKDEETESVSTGEGDEESEIQDMGEDASNETRSQLETESESAKVETVIIQEPYELTVKEYKELHGKIYNEVVAPIKTYLVTVAGIAEETTWFNEIYESPVGEASGFVAIENGSEIFVLTEYSVVQNAYRIQITFSDGSTTDAALQEYDANTGLAVVKFAKSAISDETLATISTDALSNTTMAKAGDWVAAIGAHYDSSNSASYGMVTTTSSSFKYSDSNTSSSSITYDVDYNLLSTDIMADSGGNGILVNLDGKVVGIIVQKFNGDTGSGLTLLSAVSVNQLKDLIQKLSNKEALAYLGIRGTAVPARLVLEQGMPEGLYVGDVEIDSPAMVRGIVRGDIIFEMSGVQIRNQSDYRSVIMSHAPGDSITIRVMRQGVDTYEEVPYEDVILGRAP